MHVCACMHCLCTVKHMHIPTCFIILLMFFFTTDGLGTVEGEKHGEYLGSSVTQSRPPTSTPDERQPPNFGMIKSHLPYIVLPF